MRRRLWIFGLALFLFCVMSILLLPSLLSTQWGTHFVAKAVSRSLNASVSIDSLSLSFFGPQKIEGLTITSLPDKQLSFFSPLILSESPLIDLVQKKVELRVKQGKCQISSPSLATPLLFSGIELELIRTQASSCDFTLFCTAEKGKISLQGEIEPTFSSLPKMKVDACIQALPLIGVDELLKHFLPNDTVSLATLLGPHFSTDLHIDSDGNALTLQGKAVAENLRVEIDLATKAGSLFLKKPLLIDYTVPTKMFLNPAPIALHAEVNSLKLPLDPHISLNALQGEGSFSTSTIPFANLTLKPLQGTFSFKQGLLINASSPSTLTADLFIPFQGSFFSSGSCTLKASSLPMDLLLSLFGQDPSLTELLGSSLTLSCQYAKGEGTLACKTPLLEIPSLSVQGIDRLTLIKPAPFFYTSPSLSFKGSLTTLQIPFPVTRVDATAEVDLDAYTFSSFKLDPTHLQIALSGLNAFDITLTSPRVLLSDPQGTLSFSPLTLPIHYESGNIRASLSTNSEQTGSFEALLGKTSHLTTSFTQQKTAQTLSCQIASPLLNATLLFDKQGQKLLLAKDQNQIQWTVTPEGYRFLDHYLYPDKEEKSPFQLQQPTTLRAKFTQGTLLLEDLLHSTCEGSLTDENLQFLTTETKQTISF
jgi:hypothetical protein